MYKEDDLCAFFEKKSIKMFPTRLEQILLPSVFHTEERKFLVVPKVNATMADHLISRSQTRFRTMQDHHLIQLGGVVLLQCGVFLAT